jgi:hypothetical protein
MAIGAAVGIGYTIGAPIVRVLSPPLGSVGRRLEAPLGSVWRLLVTLLGSVWRLLVSPLRLLHRLIVAPQLRAYARLETWATGVRHPSLRTTAIRGVITVGIVVTLLEASLLLVALVVAIEPPPR